MRPPCKTNGKRKWVSVSISNFIKSPNEQGFPLSSHLRLTQDFFFQSDPRRRWIQFLSWNYSWYLTLLYYCSWYDWQKPKVTLITRSFLRLVSRSFLQKNTIRIVVRYVLYLCYRFKHPSLRYNNKSLLVYTRVTHDISVNWKSISHYQNFKIWKFEIGKCVRLCLFRHGARRGALPPSSVSFDSNLEQFENFGIFSFPRLISLSLRIWKSKFALSRSLSFAIRLSAKQINRFLRFQILQFDGAPLSVSAISLSPFCRLVYPTH